MVGEPADVVARFIRGWELLDPEMILGAVAPDMVLVWGTDHDEVWRSRIELSASVDRQVEAFSQPSYSWADGDPAILTIGEISVVAGVLRVSAESQGSAHSVDMRSTFVVRGGLDDGALVHAHFSVGAERQAVPY